MSTALTFMWGKYLVSHRELKSGSHLLGLAARRREPRPRRPGVVSIGFGDVEHDAIHCSMNLIEKRPIAFTNDRKHLTLLACRTEAPVDE